MTSEWTYTITHYDESNSWASTVIAQSGTSSSRNLDSIPLFTDQGSGEVNRAIIRLNATGGKFITTGTIIDQFDKIRLQANDGQGGTYNRVYEVLNMIPSEDNAQGTTLQLDCLGNEWYFQHIHYAKPFFFDATAFAVFEDIGSLYNDNIGSKQPTLEDHDTDYNTATQLGNALPKHTRNVYDYGTNESPCYDVAMDLVDRQASSVDLGGVLDFFELAFDTDASDIHKIHARVFSSGSDPQAGGGTLVDIDATDGGTSVNQNLDESEGGISAQSATRVMAWGELGSVPNDWARYLADELDFIYRPEWTEGIQYFKDAKVLRKGTHWKADSDNFSTAGNAPDVLGSPWSPITFMVETGNVIQYSPWTDDKVNLWKEMGSGSTTQMWDGNILINYTDQEDATKNFFRSWAFQSSLPATSEYFYDRFSLPNSLPPRGYRFLNKAPYGLTGTDPFTGKAYEDALIKVDDNVGGYRVLYAASDVGAGFQVAVIEDGKVYEWDGATWNDISASATANDCFHPYSTIANVDGPQEGTKLESNGETKVFSTPNGESAVEVTSAFNTIKDTITGEYYKAFAGLCFGFPFPFKTDASYSERVGAIYGNSTTAEPATFDPLHLHLSPGGNRGFNQTDSEEITTATGLAFSCRVKYELGNTTNRDGKELLVANIPIRVTCIDTSDNKVSQEVTVAFRNNWEDLFFPINGYKVDRGVVPVFKSDAVAVLTRPKEQEAANVFEWRNLKLISIQVQSFFDEWGRFNPLKEVTTGEFLNPQSQVPMFGATVKLAVDALRFSARNLASSGVDTERNIEAPFLQRNQVFSYNQLKKDAVAMQQITQFRHREYVVGTQGKFDIKFGDSFTYTNPRTVFLAASDRGSDEAENKIKLVAKKIEYSMTKANKGKGGFIRRIYGAKRFT